MSMLDAKKIGEMALYYSSCAERDRQYAAGERQGSRLLEIFRAAIIDAIAQCESEELRERLREAWSEARRPHREAP